MLMQAVKSFLGQYYVHVLHNGRTPRLGKTLYLNFTTKNYLVLVKNVWIELHPFAASCFFFSLIILPRSSVGILKSLLVMFDNRSEQFNVLLVMPLVDTHEHFKKQQNTTLSLAEIIKSHILIKTLAK